MTTAQILHQKLLQLDQQSYKAYKGIQGTYRFLDFTLIIDHVQGDPFAAPSRLRVQIPQSKAGFPKSLYQSSSREIALRDYLNRQFDRTAINLREKRGSGNSGLIAIIRPGQQVLERSSIWIDDDQVEARFVVGLPARGRSILGQQAAELLCEDLPQIVERSLKYASLNAKAIQQHIETIEDADWLRAQLADRHLVAFIPDGAILPRQSGVNDQPLTNSALPFQAPDALRGEFDRPNQGKITGMGIPKGVTLIVGGGYHGKSTLLKAIALGIYNHIPGDGREQIITDSAAVKIRAEDGRSIVKVDISPFINHLPQGRSTTQFSTENASGSTSQAANIIEALEVGAKVLLVDEDTSATNFMIRDRRMQALIAKDKEPITPFIDKIRQLYRDYEISTILVMGGSGDYFDVADTVIAMADFEPQDVTAQAKAIAQQYATDRAPEGGTAFGQLTPRIPLPKRLDSPRERGRDRGMGRWGNRERGRAGERESERAESGKAWERGKPEARSALNVQRPIRHSEPDTRHSIPDTESPDTDLRSPKLKVRDVDELVFGTEAIDLSAVEQIVDVGQLRAIGAAITYVQEKSFNDRRTLAEVVEQVISDIATENIDVLTPYPQGDLIQFRGLELAAVINRLRSLEIK